MSNADRNAPSYLPASPVAYAGAALYVSGELAGNVTLSADYPNLIKLDPGGSARDVTLPAEASSEGLWYHIVNAANAAENLVIKNDAGDTVVTVNQNEEAIVVCQGATWVLFRVAAIALS